MATNKDGGVQWHDEAIPDDGSIPRYEKVTTGKRAFSGGIVISRKWVCAPTHWIQGRTMPCTGNNCEGCQHAVQMRLKLYLFVMGPKSRTVVCFESSDNPKRNYEDFLRMNGTMRGALLTCRRASAKKNGRVLVEFSAGNVAEALLPVEDRLKEYLERLWRVTHREDTQESRLEQLELLSEREIRLASGRKRRIEKLAVQNGKES